MSCSQLYAQASGLDFFLRSKAKEWASSTEGLFQARDSARQPQFVRAAEILFADDDDKIAWAPLKSTERAMTKAYRAYDGDVSLLLDLCRQRIAFEQVDELVDCLQLILGDQDVVVERIKNHMDDEYSGELSAGYRSDTAVESHLCESVGFLAAILMRLRLFGRCV